MKFYVTARSTKIDLARNCIETLTKTGHEVTFDWPSLPYVKPYDENVEKASGFAEAGIKAMSESDVYIFFSASDGNGVFTEFGAALATREFKPNFKIYAVGADMSEAMFYYHPAVQWFGTIEEVYKELGI